MEDTETVDPWHHHTITLITTITITRMHLEAAVEERPRSLSVLAIGTAPTAISRTLRPGISV